MRREDPTQNLSRDMARKIAFYLGNRNNFFAFSSVNKKMRGFFKKERDQIIQQGKIILADNTATFFLTFSGEIYACGGSLFGQLGLGDNRDRNHWTKTGPADKKVLLVVSKSPNTFAFCTDGVYACGSNVYGQMGGRRETISSWIKIGPTGKKVLAVKNTHSMIFVCCEDGWYGAGQNYWGGLGTGDRAQQWEWVKIQVSNKVVIDLILSDSNTFARCEDGWYACGSNNYCQIRSGSRDPVLEWVKINPPDKTVLKLISAPNTVFIECEDGWYARGSNFYGILGTGSTEEASDWIRIGEGFKKILELCINESGMCTFIRCENGWYGCGWDSSIGPEQEGDNVRTNWIMIELKGKEIFDISGRDLFNIFVRCHDGWYGRGDNFHGQLGIQQEKKIEDWMKIGPIGKEILKFISNGYSTFALCEDGWYACGSNGCGQLGCGDTKARREWIKVPVPGLIPLDKSEAEPLKISL